MTDVATRVTAKETAKETAKQFKWVGTRPVRPDGVPKVTGRAQYGADLAMPGMLVGRILRSPHAHARIRSIDIAKAAALPGVKAVVTSADFPEQPFAYVGPERVAQNFWHMTRNVMAREKVLYEGHAVAAVAAASQAIADQALSLIVVHYEVLPHVIDVDEAMQPDAPLLFPDMITRGVEPPPKPSNISKRVEYKLGDLAAGFAAADEIVEMSFKTAPVHQAYIEPQGCVARFDADGQGELWSSSQGHFVVRAYTAQLLGMKVGDLRVYPAEIGGAFGGKTVVYVEPVTVMLARKSGPRWPLTRPPFVPYCVRRELAGQAARNYALHTRIFRELVAVPFAIEEVVAGLPTPALIVWGDRDNVLDVSGAAILHRALPGSRLVVMPGIGHLPMLEAPRPTAAAYRAFRAALAEKQQQPSVAVSAPAAT